MNALQKFIDSTGPGRFLTDKTLPELVKLARLCPVLVRAGGCRFMCAAQDVPHLERCLKAGGDYVRDVSFTGDADKFALGWAQERLPLTVQRAVNARAQSFPRTPEDQRARYPGSPFNEADCGGAFDGTRVTSDADPGL